MAKIRVYDLAKRLGISKDEAMERLKAAGVEVKSSLSSVEEDALGPLPAPARPAAKPKAAAGGLTSVRPGAASLKQTLSPAMRRKALLARPLPARPKTAASAAAVAPAAQPPAQPEPAAPSAPAPGTRSTTPAAAPPAAAAVAIRQAATPALRSPAHTAGEPVRRPITVPRPAPRHAVPPTSGPALAPGARPVAPAAPGKAATPAALRPPVAIPRPAGAPAAPPTVTAPRLPAAVSRPPLATPAAPSGVTRTAAAVAGPAAGRPAATGLPPRPPVRPLAPLPPRSGMPSIPRRLPGLPIRPPLPPGYRPPRLPGAAPRPHPPAARPPVQPRPAAEPAAPRPAPPPPAPIPAGPMKSITISEGVTIKELAEKMDVKSKDLIRRLLDRGLLATINQTLDPETAVMLCKDFNHEARVISFEEEAVQQTVEEEVQGGRTLLRPPVVTIMGHVDHGKTTLLDAIRESNIVAHEHGGITQHIGAYRVEVKGRSIVFLDTPGHEAFTKMRARGAKVTDVVLLVVAADDGVQPQTVEAIHHARAASVPIVVAINKIDKAGANPDRVKQALSEHDLLVHDWGGKVESVPISARQRKGLDDLLDTILLVADADLEKALQAHPDRRAAGTVLEAKLDRTRGPVATILVQDGTLEVGDPFIAGAVHGKVRAMFDDRGAVIKKAGPSWPVEVLGLNGVPQAGDLFQVVSEEAKARQIGSFRQLKLREERVAKTSRLTLQHLHERVAEGSVKELPIILKGDVQGSVEVLAKTLHDLSTGAVKIKVLHAAPGAITESDVLLASASNAIIYGFNVRPERKATDLAEKEGVDMRLHTVIYEISDEIKKAMAGLLEPTIKEVFLGRAEVRQLFKVPKGGTVAGCLVIEGRIARSAMVRLLRDSAVTYKGRIASLRHLKDDVSEVKQDFECGIMLERFSDVKVGDVIEAYRTETVAATA